MPQAKQSLLPGREAATREDKEISWEDIQRIAFGELCMHPVDLYEYTMEEFILKVQGARYQKRDHYREHWEMTRVIAYENAVMAGKELKKSMTPHRFLSFPWDEKTGLGSLSEDERKSAVKKLREQYLAAAKASKN